ncbi:MAG: hypothetical protein MUF52_02410 [Syntrophobacteraceae bacterium]|jgi:hypothetical protein|nr:hypothetical protein [Syntrophobacteraceae bacterium]
MGERIRVLVNGRPVEIYRGMKVKHALIAYDQNVYAAAAEGRVVVEDVHGFRVGLEGALSDGAAITTRMLPQK